MQHRDRCRRPDPEVVSEFTADVWRAANTLVAHMRRVLEPHGLTFAEHEVLRHICEYDTATVDSTAGRLGLPVDQVAQIVTFLAGRDLVRANGNSAEATHRGHTLSAEVQHAISVEESLLLCPNPVQQVWATSELLARTTGRAGQLGPNTCRQSTTSDPLTT
ncbi:hypothetical protein [Polymorphospora rubra]|uniref:MarR family transcriptional regulator n=1 Tax=Polymorphospora rubra TaxID=338584 RepID=A0A810MUL4_9ACTN|nr:hypothetical protein [Polymorphospora rubra]BCJ62988.1 hypothetical protein Prubr_00090 [Polymorphospora rubra]